MLTPLRIKKAILKTRPVFIVIHAAQIESPLVAHSRECNMWPPSRSGAGSRLKRAITIFISTVNNSVPQTEPGKSPNG